MGAVQSAARVSWLYSAALLCRLPNCPVGGTVVANNNLSPGKVERSLVRAAAAAAGPRHAHST